jgi:hypothetical protein
MASSLSGAHAAGDADHVDHHNLLDTTVKAKMDAGLAGLPAGVKIQSTSTTRPTTRPDLHVTFATATDPGTNALPGDDWDRI